MDWRYYAEKLRQAKANFDDRRDQALSGARPMIEAAFDGARRLFGITSRAQRIPGLASDVAGLEVKDRRPAQGAVLWRLFRQDLEALRRLDDLRCATSRSSDGEVAPADPQRLQFSPKALTANPRCSRRRCAPCSRIRPRLHACCPNVTIPRSSGTSVFTDFVELPSQLLRALAGTAEVLQKFSPALPDRRAAAEDLLQRFLAARKFTRALHTIEFVSSALLDSNSTPAGRGEAATSVRSERAEMERSACPRRSVLRHRPQQFAHISPAITMPRLLQLHVVGGDGCRRIRRVRGGRRHLRSHCGQASA